MHGKQELVYLEKYEHVCQYWRIPEHAFYGEIYELLMSVVLQERAEVELCSGFLIGGENG